MKRWAILCALLLWPSGVSSAQSGVSCHLGHHKAESKFRELPGPPRMDGLGNSSLKITTSSEDAQAYFNQGLRLLHCFWEFEAYRAFKEAARLDSSAAMAYWGIVEALKGEKAMADERKAAMEKAKSLVPKVSEHEQYYIRAAEHLEEPDEEKGRSAYDCEMEGLIDRYPDDVDAKLFLALSLMAGYEPDGRPKEGELYSQAILRNVLTSHPDNAAANHYWIHAVETSSRPEEALTAAELRAHGPHAGTHLLPHGRLRKGSPIVSRLHAGR